MQGNLINKNAQPLSVSSRARARTSETCYSTHLCLLLPNKNWLKATKKLHYKSSSIPQHVRPATTCYSRTSIDTPSLNSALDEVRQLTVPWIGKEIGFRRAGSVSHPARTLILPSPRGPNPPTDMPTILCAAKLLQRLRRGRSRCRGCWQQLILVIRATGRVCLVWEMDVEGEGKMILQKGQKVYWRLEEATLLPRPPKCSS